jgi:hypothetical protein
MKRGFFLYSYQFDNLKDDTCSKKTLILVRKSVILKTLNLLIIFTFRFL